MAESDLCVILGARLHSAPFSQKPQLGRVGDFWVDRCFADVQLILVFRRMGVSKETRFSSCFSLRRGSDPDGGAEGRGYELRKIYRGKLR